MSRPADLTAYTTADSSATTARLVRVGARRVADETRRHCRCDHPTVAESAEVARLNRALADLRHRETGWPWQDRVLVAVSAAVTSGLVLLAVL